MNNFIIDIEQIKIKYPNLIFDKKSQLLKGELSINSKFRDEIINEKYIVEINLNYQIPVVYDVGKKIRKNYSHKYNDSSLCLATDIEQLLFLLKNKRISLWIEKFVENYYVSYEYYIRYGVYPFGEYSHGKEGLLEFYYDYYYMNNLTNKDGFLEYIFIYNYKGHYNCPCGNKKKIRNCHKDFILKSKKDPNFNVLQEYYRKEIYEKKKL